MASAGTGGDGAVSRATGGAGFAGAGSFSKISFFGLSRVRRVNSSTVTISTGNKASFVSSAVMTGVQNPTTTASVT